MFEPEQNVWIHVKFKDFDDEYDLIIKECKIKTITRHYIIVVPNLDNPIQKTIEIEFDIDELKNERSYQDSSGKSMAVTMNLIDESSFDEYKNFSQCDWFKFLIIMKTMENIK